MKSAKRPNPGKKVKSEVKRAIKEVGRAKGIKEGKTPEKALVKELKQGTPTQQATGKYFRRNFTKRDAARMAWMLCVADPFGSKAVPVPATLTPGASMSCPRMYSVTLKNFAVVNAAGCAFIGLNADAWLPNPSAAAGSPPVPYKLYLGNSTSNAGTRGWPLHYTIQTYVGGGGVGATGKSYPSPANSVASATLGITFQQLPDNFIDAQLNGNPASGNAFQRFQCVSAGLRVRPTAPAAGALVQTGVVMMVQQTLGDTVLTNPASANQTASAGGNDCYGYMSGLSNLATGGVTTTNVPGLAPDSIGSEEWDIAEWPKSRNEKNWLEAAAIPNQSCSFGQWTAGQTGDNTVGYPQVAAIVAGSQSGQQIEYEARLVYAFYGTVSYQENAAALVPSVPVSDLAATVTDGAAHLSISNRATTPKRAGIQAMVQPSIEDGSVHPSNAAAWINSGKEVIESATGSSIGELVGEGLGFLAAALL